MHQPPAPPLRRLPGVGITAASFLNAAGRGDFSPENASQFQAPWLSAGLRPLADAHPPVFWGRINAPLAPLPSSLSVYESRCAKMLAECLAPLATSLSVAVQRYGSERIGIVLGSSTGGIDATESALSTELRLGIRPPNYQFADAHPYGALLSVARNLTGISGPGYVVSTACSSAGKAIAAAQRLIATRTVDAVLTGGVDALTGLTLGGFSALRLISDRTCTPFGRERDGICLGEGAALLLLECGRDHRLWLLGAGESSDAHHPTAPHPHGLGARLAIQRCLDVSGVKRGDVRYIQAHGTGTLQNDAVESRAIFEEFGTIPFSSTKDRTGHQLGAAAATSAVFCIDALLSNRIHGSLEELTPDDRLAVQPLARSQELAPAEESAVTLLNAFAFGGNNVTLALGRGSPHQCQDSPRTSETHQLRVGLRAATCWTDREPVERDGILDRRTWGRASPLTRIFAWLLSDLGRRAKLTPEDLGTTPLFLGSGFGELKTSLGLLDQLTRGESLSPAKFQSSVHNTAAGMLSIATSNHEPTSAISAGQDTVSMTLLEASCWLGCHGRRACVLLADEDGPEHLLGDAAFPALGAGFLLEAEEETSLDLAWPAVASWPTRDGRDAGHPLASPIAWALPLVQAANAEAPGTIWIGPERRVELTRGGRR